MSRSTKHSQPRNQSHYRACRKHRSSVDFRVKVDAPGVIKNSESERFLQALTAQAREITDATALQVTYVGFNGCHVSSWSATTRPSTNK